VRGFLRVEHSRFGALMLTQSSRELLRGERELLLREDPEKTKPRTPRVKYDIELEDEDLLEDLKTLRKRFADEQGVPPYVVFHDATLIEMIQHRPTTSAQLLELSGIGQAKLQRYGDAFLDLLRHHQL